MTSELRNYDLEFLKEKFEEKGLFAELSFQDVAKSLKEFFELVAGGGERPLALLSKPVDELWHLFITFTPQYRQFCSSIMGFYVDHQPHTPRTPVPAEAIVNFIGDYERHFHREPGDIWFWGIDDDTARSLKCGIVPESFQFKWSGWTGKIDQTMCS